MKYTVAWNAQLGVWIAGIVSQNLREWRNKDSLLFAHGIHYGGCIHSPTPLHSHVGYFADQDVSRGKHQDCHQIPQKIHVNISTWAKYLRNSGDLTCFNNSKGSFQKEVSWPYSVPDIHQNKCKPLPGAAYPVWQRTVWAAQRKGGYSFPMVQLACVCMSEARTTLGNASVGTSSTPCWSCQIFPCLHVCSSLQKCAYI